MSNPDEFLKRCVLDGVMMLMGQTQNEFKNAFLASVVGHILLIFAFQFERNGVVEESHDPTKDNVRIHKWHNIGYIILLADCVIEFVWLLSVPKTDPIFIKDGGYTSCGPTEITEITDETNDLRSLGWKLSIVRSISAAAVILCYHHSGNYHAQPLTHEEFALIGKKNDDADVGAEDVLIARPATTVPNDDDHIQFGKL